MPVASPRVAVALVEELMAGGVREVVLSPGSRSAPIALVIADAARRQLLRLHVRIDERSAAYLALGLAQGSGDPVAVVTTSGTAAVNLHPAMVEAAHSGLPLIAVTADRPGAMRGTGANQTIDQRGLFAPDVTDGIDLEGLEEPALRSEIREALRRTRVPRPLHINVPLAEPLVAPGEHAVGDVTGVRPDGDPEPVGVSLASVLPPGVGSARGVLVAGDFTDPGARAAAAALADSLGWPIISEPSGNLSSHPRALRHGPLLLDAALRHGRVPEVVVTVGRVGLHRSVSRLLRSADAHIAVDVPPRRGWVDPVQTARAVVDAVPTHVPASRAGDDDASSADAAWMEMWRSADAAVGRVVGDALAGDELSGPSVARIVASLAAGDDLLVIGASWPVRHVSAYAGALASLCIGNRGTSGIDGVVSFAWGAALAHQGRHVGSTAYALVGDLTALYDRNGLLAPATEGRPRLDYVVIDNDGGGIFSSLEQGAPDFAADFERVFGTPHGGDLRDLLTAPGVEVVIVTTVAELTAALRGSASGVRVIIARCIPRDAEAALVRSLQATADSMLEAALR